ncbi:MAG: polymer-forming cytoskeletal protein [Spirochaetales bacterium]
MRGPEGDPTVYINSIIGENSSFKGDLSVSGFFRIDGDFQGNAQTEGRILVGRHGRVKGNLTARDIVVGGIIKGNLSASEKITLMSTALVVGNVYAPRIQIDNGVVIDGSCCATPRIRETGEHPLMAQKAYTLKIDTGLKVRTPADVALAESSGLGPSHG